ncbi:MAG TPA: hypothetical protein VGK33_01270, partial [Chloroflexota bacterium]
MAARAARTRLNASCRTRGTKFVCKTDLTGILVAKAVGKPLADYLSETIWGPYGMEQDAAWLDLRWRRLAPIRR